MRESRQPPLAGRSAREFEAFVAGAGGRLLHVATLLTAEPSGRCLRAQRLLLGALARLCAEWDRLRDEDPYDRTRQELVTRFTSGAWRPHRRSRTRGTGAEHGVLARLGPQERLVVVLTLYEGVPEAQTAALLGLPQARVRTLGTRAVSLLRGARAPAAAGTAPGRRPGGRPTGRQGLKEEEVRRMLDLPYPRMPADLHVRASRRGARLRRRRRTLHRVECALLLVAAIVFAVWAVAVEPWAVPPSATTPEIGGW